MSREGRFAPSGDFLRSGSRQILSEAGDCVVILASAVAFRALVGGNKQAGLALQGWALGFVQQGLG
ncbi:hypothetical protein C5688_13075 [Methylocystis sp. MitZ-2018]|nr:hypothetical protein C5688_13075 [Methylocystis sp. MitZ-2018]